MKRRTQEEIVLCDFTVANLLGKRVSPVVHVGEQPQRGQFIGNLLGILFLHMGICELRRTVPGMDKHDAHRGRQRESRALDEGIARMACRHPFVE